MSRAPLLRPARPTDAGKLGEMITRAARAHDWKPVLHSAAEDIAHAGQMIERGWITVAESHGTATGFLAREADYIHALFVAPGAQGRGIGKALLDHAKARCAELTLWTFRNNAQAQRFYLREGFRIAATGDGSGNEEGLPDIRFTWSAHAARQPGTGACPVSSVQKYPGGAPQERGAAPPSDSRHQNRTKAALRPQAQHIRQEQP